jgi:hypothetical protein
VLAVRRAGWHKWQAPNRHHLACERPLLLLVRVLGLWPLLLLVQGCAQPQLPAMHVRQLALRQHGAMLQQHGLLLQQSLLLRLLRLLLLRLLRLWLLLERRGCPAECVSSCCHRWRLRPACSHGCTSQHPDVRATPLLFMAAQQACTCCCCCCCCCCVCSRADITSS